MKLTHRSVGRVSVSPSGTLEIEVLLAADVPGELVAELMLDPHRGATFVRDGRRVSAVDAEMYAGTAVDGAVLSFTLAGGAASGGEAVPLLVRFNPRGGGDPDEIYLEVPLPRPSE